MFGLILPGLVIQLGRLGKRLLDWCVTPLIVFCDLAEAVLLFFPSGFTLGALD